MSYRQWYGLQRWRERAQQQLHDHPLCEMCLQKGVVTAAEVADHVEPHKGDEIAFWHGDLQSLCFHHHNSQKQIEEGRGYSNEIGTDGWPVDPAHPANSHKNGYQHSERSPKRRLT